MQATQVSFQTKDRIKLHGLWYRPNQGKNVAIYIHGTGDSSILRKGVLLQALSKKLATKKYDVMAFNNRGSGYVSSVKKYNHDGVAINKVMAGMAYERISECVKDIDASIDWASANGYKKVTLIGHSTGANKAIIYANSGSKRLQMVKKIILLGGGDDITLQNSRISNPDKYLRKIQKEVDAGKADRMVPGGDFPGEHPITYGSLLELITEHSDYDIFPFARYEQDNKKYFKKYRKVNIPMTAIYGSEDFGTVINVDQALKILTDLNGYLSAVTIDGADHSFTRADDKLAAEISKAL